MKTSVSAIYEEKNINVDFSIFVNANHSVEKHWNANKTKTNFFFLKIIDTLSLKMLRS